MSLGKLGGSRRTDDLVRFAEWVVRRPGAAATQRSSVATNRLAYDTSTDDTPNLGIVEVQTLIQSDLDRPTLQQRRQVRDWVK